MKAGAWIILATISFLLALGSLTFARDHDPILILGSWNIRWLGRPDAPRRGKSYQKPWDIAKIIQWSRVDLLALQEIYDNDNAKRTRRNNTLDAVIRILNERGSSAWKYRLFPKKDPEDLHHHTGIMWNQGKVRPVGLPFKIPMNVPRSENPNYWSRWPYAMKFSAGRNKTDVVIISIHMKSNVTRPEDKIPPTEQRKREAHFLVGALDRVKTRLSDSDIILIGDFNVLRSSEPAVTAYTNAGFADLNQCDEPTMAVSRAPFDRAFVAKGQPELRQCKIVVFRPYSLSPYDFNKRLSDHLPITIKVRVVEDDD